MRSIMVEDPPPMGFDYPNRRGMTLRQSAVNGEITYHGVPNSTMGHDMKYHHGARGG